MEARGELKSLCSPTLFFMIPPRLLMGPDSSPQRVPSVWGRRWGGGGLWAREDSKVNARKNEGVWEAVRTWEGERECAPVSGLCLGHV